MSFVKNRRNSSGKSSLDLSWASGTRQRLLVAAELADARLLELGGWPPCRHWPRLAGPTLMSEAAKLYSPQSFSTSAADVN